MSIPTLLTDTEYEVLSKLWEIGTPISMKDLLDEFNKEGRNWKMPTLKTFLTRLLNAGYLVSTVLEVMHNGKDIAILDTSAACHMPDVLEMPYRPPVWRAGEPGKKAFTYLLTGRSCLAGDVIGEYSFDTRLFEGEQVVFGDMALYTMVKTNTFNGVPLPLIAIRRADGTDEAVRMSGYEDFKRRLS